MVTSLLIRSPIHAATSLNAVVDQQQVVLAALAEQLIWLTDQLRLLQPRILSWQASEIRFRRDEDEAVFEGELAALIHSLGEETASHQTRESFLCHGVDPSLQVFDDFFAELRAGDEGRSIHLALEVVGDGFASIAPLMPFITMSAASGHPR